MYKDGKIEQLTNKYQKYKNLTQETTNEMNSDKFNKDYYTDLVSKF